MSLLFIIDGYNVINHPAFNKLSRKSPLDKRVELISLIKSNNLCGSSNNKAIVVFDGHSVDLEYRDFAPVATVIFSRKQSADERIKSIVEESSNPRNTVVVSDDKEVTYYARSLKAKIMGVEDFLVEKAAVKRVKTGLPKQELSYEQEARINNELKKIWLK